MSACVRFVGIGLVPLVEISVLGVFLFGCLGVLVVALVILVLSLYPFALHRSLPQQLTDVRTRDKRKVCVGI